MSADHHAFAASHAGTTPPGPRSGPGRSGLVVALVALVVGLLCIVLVAATAAQQAEASDDVRASLDRLDGEVASLSEEVDSLRADIASLQGDVAAIEDDAIDVAHVRAQALPSIVTVYCDGGQGTGFAYEVVPPADYATTIVTNEHVIEDCTYSDGARTITLETSDGDEFEGFVWGWDEDNDLATIQTAETLPRLGDARDASVGDPVVAVGSPQGLSNSVTLGIVSNVYSDAYQTDAAVNHGNSGGPLLDRAGGLLGVTTLALDREGLNIAVRTGQFCIEILHCPG